jgi:hypothetical protein
MRRMTGNPTIGETVMQAIHRVLRSGALIGALLLAISSAASAAKVTVHVFLPGAGPAGAGIEVKLVDPSSPSVPVAGPAFTNSQSKVTFQNLEKGLRRVVAKRMTDGAEGTADVEVKKKKRNVNVTLVAPTAPPPAPPPPSDRAEDAHRRRVSGADGAE